MKKLTIFDISKILRFDEKQTVDLKNRYDTADAEGRIEIMDIMWDAFFELHEKLSDSKYKQLLDEVAEGKRELTNDLYFQAKKLAMKELEEIVIGKPQEKNEMEEIRNKLKFLTENTQKGSVGNSTTNST